MKNNAIIIKLGGSLLVPDGTLNIPYIKSFYAFIRKQVRKKRRFFIQVGGGQLSRVYINAGKAITDGSLTHDQLDWLGLHATRLNSFLFRTIFDDIAHPTVITDYTYIQKPTAPVVIASGWKPGHSTDYNAVVLAQDYCVDTIIKLSNTEYIYNADPWKNPQAKPYKNMTWRRYNTMFGGAWQPGNHVPFDPEASKMAARTGVQLVFMKGTNLANLECAIEQKPFVGTIIK